MFRFTLSAALLLGLAASGASQTATISEIGIEGFYRNPVRVRISVTNPRPTPVTLDVKLSVSDSDKDAGLRPQDQFTASVSIQASETRSIDLPVAFAANKPVLSLEVRAGGALVAHQIKTVERQNHDGLVLLVCVDDKTCNQTLGALSSSGSDEEKARKSQAYTFLVLKELPDAWWIYAPAHSIILARPASQLSATQREALEGYLRQNGRLLLLDAVVGPGFLDPYRTDAAHGTRQRLGTGEFVRFSDNAQLASFFDRSVREPLENDGDAAVQFRTDRRGYRGFTLDLQRNPLATVFEFPTFGWLIFWICAYIVVVGLVNFFVLTRLNRRDLAWVTVPSIAFLFALGLYIMSAAKRPRTIALDEVATYFMDDVQPVASGTINLRVSSPQAEDLTLVVPGSAVWDGNGRPLTPFAGISIFDRKPDFGESWSIRLQPQREFSLPLLQWSFQDLTFTGPKTFPGTIRRLDGNRLSNQTGLSFREAVLLEKGCVYNLGAVAEGAALNAHPGTPENAEALLQPRWEQMQDFESGRAGNPPSREELRKYLASAILGYKTAFAGLAEVPALNAALPGHTFAHRQYVVVIVAFEDAP